MKTNNVRLYLLCSRFVSPSQIYLKVEKSFCFWRDLNPELLDGMRELSRCWQFCGQRCPTYWQRVLGSIPATTVRRYHSNFSAHPEQELNRSQNKPKLLICLGRYKAQLSIGQGQKKGSSVMPTSPPSKLYRSPNFLINPPNSDSVSGLRSRLPTSVFVLNVNGGVSCEDKSEVEPPIHHVP